MAYSVAYAKHFPEGALIGESNYHLPGGLTKAISAKVKLNLNAVPSIFPNLPRYLSKTVQIQRKDPAERTRALKDCCDDTPLRFHPAALHGAVFHTVQYLHGDFGAAAIRAGFIAKYCNPQTRIAVIRHDMDLIPHRLVASSLPYIKNIDNVRVNVFSLYIGATIRHCYKFILNYQKHKFEKYCLSLKTDEEKNELKKAFFNLDIVLKIK